MASDHVKIRLIKVFLVLSVLLAAGLAAERVWTEFRLRKLQNNDSLSRLALENQALRSRLDKLQTLKKDPSAISHLVAPGGEPRLLDDLYGERGVAFFLFSSDCESCKAEADEWGDLSTRLRDLGYPVFLVSVEDHDFAGRYTSEHALDIPVLCDKAEVMRKDFSVGFTPCKLVIDKDSCVAYKDSRLLLPEERLAAFKLFLAGEEKQSKAEILPMVRKVFPDADDCRILRLPSNVDVLEKPYYEVRRGAQTLGYVAEVHREIPCDVCSDVDFLVGVTLDGKVSKVAILQGYDDLITYKRMGIAAIAGIFFGVLLTLLLKKTKALRGSRGIRFYLVSILVILFCSAAFYLGWELIFPRIDQEEFLMQITSEVVREDRRIEQDGGEIVAITGATKSSREILSGVIETIKKIQTANVAATENKR